MRIVPTRHKPSHPPVNRTPAPPLYHPVTRTGVHLTTNTWCDGQCDVQVWVRISKEESHLMRKTSRFTCSMAPMLEFNPDLPDRRRPATSHVTSHLQFFGWLDCRHYQRESRPLAQSKRHRRKILTTTSIGQMNIYDFMMWEITLSTMECCHRICHIQRGDPSRWSWHYKTATGSDRPALPARVAPLHTVLNKRSDIYHNSLRVILSMYAQPQFGIQPARRQLYVLTILCSWP